MITITSYKEVENEDSQSFNMLMLEGEVEPVKSKDSGKWYFTSRKAGVPCTFDAEKCEKLIGKEMPGEIQRVPCDPYEYKTDDGETIILEHTYEYNPEPVTTEEHVFENEQEKLPAY